MNKLSPTAVLIIQKLLGKLLEKSSVAGYIVAGLGTLGINNPALGAQAAGWLATVAGIVLFLLNDPTFSRLLVAKPVTSGDVIEPKPITVPAPVAVPAPIPAASAAPTEDSSMSLLTSITGVFANLNPVVSAALNAVTLVEALFPNAPGVQKLAAAQAYVQKAVGTAVDVTSDIEGVLATLKAAGVISSSTTQAQPTPVATA